MLQYTNIPSTLQEIHGSNDQGLILRIGERQRKRPVWLRAKTQPEGYHIIVTPPKALGMLLLMAIKKWISGLLVSPFFI
jgi:hypothetical protein